MLMLVISLLGAASAAAHGPKAGTRTVPQHFWGEWREDNRSQCGSADASNRILFGPRLWDMQGDAFEIKSIRFRGRHNFAIYTLATDAGSPFANFDYDPKTDLLVRDSEIFVYRCPAPMQKAL